jgi:hypothetical protein
MDAAAGHLLCVSDPTMSEIQRIPMWRGQNPLRFVQYESVQSSIKNADLLLCRTGRRLCDLAISAAARSPYVHAGMAAWIDGKLSIVDVLQFHGGRIVPLADEVSRHPGRYDVYRANTIRFPELDRDAAVEQMRHYADGQYGWWNVVRASLRHLAFVRLLIPPLTDDKANGTYPPFCSQAAGTAYREAGVDPVPNLADRVTEPGDLARSLLFSYFCTLTV